MKRTTIRRARERARLTQAQAADAAGWPQSLWSAYESGRKSPAAAIGRSLATLERIAGALDVPPATFVSPELAERLRRLLS